VNRTSISVATFFDLLKTTKGWQKPGHKYLYRIPLPGGGYRYYYKHAQTGAMASEDFTNKQNAGFDEDVGFISAQDKAVEEFVNFTKSNFQVKQFIKEMDTNFNGFFGRTWEIFATFPDANSYNDAMMKTRFYLDQFKDEHHQKILKDFVNRMAALKESKNDFHIQRMVEDRKVMWNYLRNASDLMNNVGFEHMRVVSTAHIQTKTMTSDLQIVDAAKEDKNNDLGLLMVNMNKGTLNAVGISSKALEGKSDITVKNYGAASVIHNLAELSKQMLKDGDSKSADVMKRWAGQMKRTYDSADAEARTVSKGYKEFQVAQRRIEELKKQGAVTFQKWIKKKMPEAAKLTPGQINIYSEFRQLTKMIANAQNTWKSTRLQETFFKALKDDKFNQGFSDELYSTITRAISDSTVAEMLMVAPYYEQKTGKHDLFIIREKKLKRRLRDLLSPGNFSVEMRRTGETEIMGKKIDSYSNIDVRAKIGGDFKKLAEFRFRKDMSKIYVQLDRRFMLDFYKKNNEAEALTNELESRGYGKKLRKDLEDFVDLHKAAATLERKKMNAKYIRKELTESGKVRYIYKEAQPRHKKNEEVPTESRDHFLSTVDSVDSASQSLFNDAVSEIDDVHFNTINAGAAGVRITNDVEVFLDYLEVPPKLKNKDEFRSSCGLFNASKGKMGFCMSNFPDDVHEMIKKAVMMHEVGHSFFYGALRIKEKDPLTTSDPKDREQKKFSRESIKFVDGFGKIDEEIRKKVEDKVELADVKGKDKEALLLDTIKTYMVSEYATLNSEEHFAEAFSRYFIMPEQLRRKEEEVYNHFNQFFQKYNGR
jgi:hypothetical protein